jgi:hypothetical protein
MKSYFLKFSGREEGPYGEAHIAQMFADRRVDRNTPCKPADNGDWKTIDDYLPILKYGTQLPSPTEVRNVPPPPLPPPPMLPAQRIAVVDLDIPFGSVLKIMFKWMGAACIVGFCLMPVVLFIWLIIMALFAGIITDSMSSLRHP